MNMKEFSDWFAKEAKERGVKLHPEGIKQFLTNSMAFPDPRAAKTVMNYDRESLRMHGYIAPGLFSGSYILHALDNYLGLAVAIFKDNSLSPTNQIGEDEIRDVFDIRDDIDYLERHVTEKREGLIRGWFTEVELEAYEQWIRSKGYEQRFQTNYPSLIRAELMKEYRNSLVGMLPRIAWALYAIAQVPRTAEEAEKMAEQDRGARDAAIALVTGLKVQEGGEAKQ